VSQFVISAPLQISREQQIKRFGIIVCICVTIIAQVEKNLTMLRCRKEEGGPIRLPCVTIFVMCLEFSFRGAHFSGMTNASLKFFFWMVDPFPDGKDPSGLEVYKFTSLSLQANIPSQQQHTSIPSPRSTIYLPRNYPSANNP
jgi:hypothetical protein